MVALLLLVGLFEVITNGICNIDVLAAISNFGGKTFLITTQKIESFMARSALVVLYL